MQQSSTSGLQRRPPMLNLFLDISLSLLCLWRVASEKESIRPWLDTATCSLNLTRPDSGKIVQPIMYYSTIVAIASLAIGKLWQDFY